MHALPTSLGWDLDLIGFIYMGFALLQLYKKTRT